MNTLVKIVGLLAVVVLCFGEELFDCTMKIPVSPNDDKEFNDTADNCRKELNLQELKEEDLLSDQIFDSSYDDKCLTKCILEKMNYMKGDKLNRTFILKDAEESILDKKDTKFVAKIVEITNKCLDEAEKLSKPSPCAQASYFGFCLGKAHDKICMPSKEK